MNNSILFFFHQRKSSRLNLFGTAHFSFLLIFLSLIAVDGRYYNDMKPSYHRRNFYVSRRPSFVPDLYSSKCRVKEDLFEPIKPLTVPWITVDLDLPPVYRFQKAFRPYSAEIRQVITIVKSFVGAFGELPIDILEIFMKQAHDKLFPSPYREEIDVTLNINYMKNGELLFKGTTFAGHVGIITGMKPNSFTLSMNSQIKPDLQNLIKWLSGMFMRKRPESPHFVMWVERETMTYAANYQEAKNYLSNVKLLTGCYFILGGKNSGEGVVMVRDADITKQLVELDPQRGKWFLLQTNYDPNEKPFYLDNRRDPGVACMHELGQNELSLAGLYKVLSSKTTLNKTTVHSVIMSIEDDLYETFLQSCPDPCWFI